MPESGLLTTDGLFGDLRPIKKGKVRDIYQADEHLLIVATDRISAYDVVMAEPIPDKGKVLNLLSVFWFAKLSGDIDHHFITADPARYPEPFSQYADILRHRSMLVYRSERQLPVECVVRGYLCGSAWSEYQRNGRVCGISLLSGLTKGRRLPTPIFTPATKSESGHDENITFRQMRARLERCSHGCSRALACQLRSDSLAIYKFGQAYANERGIIIADTKFEFGIHNCNIILIDEILTPDSSRFWRADDWKAGRIEVSLDKQPLRDWLDNVAKWDHRPPAPHLPDEVVAETSERYRLLYQLITGFELPG